MDGEVAQNDDWSQWLKWLMNNGSNCLLINGGTKDDNRKSDGMYFKDFYCEKKKIR